MTELLVPGAGGGAGTAARDVALTGAAQGLTAKPLSPGRLAWRRFRRHKLAMASAVVLVLLTIVVFFPSLVTEYEPFQPVPDIAANHGPTWGHPFGVNGLRHDMLSKVLHGGQISLQVGFFVAIAAGLFGSLVGAFAGYYGRWVDNLLMRVTDLFLAIPALVALILLARVPARHADVELFMPSFVPFPVHLTVEDVMGQGGSVRAIVTILALLLWMPMARIVRGVVLSLKEKEFVEAARAMGATDRRILFRHLLPNCVGVIIVNVTLTVAIAILTESALSFLGFGVESAVNPTWGNLLDDARGLLRTSPHLVWFPGLAIVVTVLCVNYLGDGLRDALDPRQTRNKA